MAKIQKFDIMKILLDENMEVNLNFSGITQFQDKKLEQNYLKDNMELEYFQNLLSNSIIIAGYLTSLLYIYFIFYHNVLFNVCLVNLCLSLLIIIFSDSSKIKITSEFKDRILIFINYFTISFKIYFIIFNLSNKLNDYNPEILRILFYLFLSTNLYVVMKLQSNIYDYAFYNFLNCITVTIIEIYSISNHHYYFELILLCILGLLFFFIRKLWDFNNRIIYSERKKN